ncbi:tRNA 2-thiouridine(34) synthase MnmA [Candidatus Saccharibacteria bacterium 32-50-10]|nr:MAG: tRNA 2-thiouridine(34) synthase MnmA [Candidatus Saccharibacteria bacterium 32-50-10]
MSGGVDSSLTAALLKEQGHEVVGVYMKNWTRDLPGMRCPWADDLADAKRVAVRLGIDFKVYDFENEYRQKVVDYMIDEYRRGRTPNPDIMCNQEVKFKLFLEAALADGAEIIATGHYARTENGRLLMAVDDKKDQTYFLYRVTSDALRQTVFPIGEFDKQTVRQMAAERGLITADKKDSQGICFVGQIGMREFLSEYVDTKPGPIIDKLTNQPIGTHDGAIFYTIGQRHGLDLGGGLPYYVVGKNMDRNEVYVTTNLNDDQLWRPLVELADVHWIKGVAPIDGTYRVRARHRGALLPARVVNSDGTVRLEFEQPERAIAAGQSVVIYDGDECLGGGIVLA